MSDPKVLVRCRYEAEIWTDPWGRKGDGYVITGTAVIERTDETVQRDDGYEMRTDPVWASTYPDRRFQAAQNYIDYHGGTTWIDLDAQDEADGHDVGSWEEPKEHRPYVLDNGASITADFITTYPEMVAVAAGSDGAPPLGARPRG